MSERDETHPFFPALPEPPPGGGASHAEEPEAAPEEPRHPVAAVLLAVGILSGIGVSAFLLTRPLPCDRASFSSPVLGYCLTLPKGWTTRPDDGSTGTATDLFSRDDGVASLAVQAVALPEGGTLATMADRIRRVDADAGYMVSDTKPTLVAGVPATSWETSPGRTSERAPVFDTLEIVVVHDGFAWRITFSDTLNGLRDDVGEFGAILSSWHFK